MNKKTGFVIFILLVIIVVLVVVCLRTCRKKDALSNAESSAEPQSREELYAQLNSLLNNVGYPVILTVKTTEDGNVFNGSYTITEHGDVRAANYSYEKLSTFEINGDDVVIPNDFKTTYTGRIKIKDGKIIEQNGAAINVAVEALNAGGLTLSASALENVKTDRGNFSADITSLKTVTGMDVAATGAKINISYTDVKITTIVLSYSASSYHTEMTYRFS